MFQSNIGIHDSVWDIVRAARAPLFNAVFALVAQINGEDSREVLSIRAGSTNARLTRQSFDEINLLSAREFRNRPEGQFVVECYQVTNEPTTQVQD